MISVHDATSDEETGRLSRFRELFYGCLTRRADALFDLTDALLCADGPVTSLVGLSLAAEHRRGHGSTFAAVNDGRIQIARLRRAVGQLRMPRDDEGRITLAVDVSAWLRPDAACAPDRSFCHVHGRGKSASQMIPGWPYSVVVALESGRTSWTTPLDALRLGPLDDLTTVTAAQVREVIGRLVRAGHWREGDRRIRIVLDAGYDVVRLAWLVRDLPVDLVGRLRSDRVLHLPAAPGPPVRWGGPANMAG